MNSVNCIKVVKKKNGSRGYADLTSHHICMCCVVNGPVVLPTDTSKLTSYKNYSAPVAKLSKKAERQNSEKTEIDEIYFLHSAYHMFVVRLFFIIRPCIYIY